MEYLSFPGLSSGVTRGLVTGTITFITTFGFCGLVGNVCLILSVIRQSRLRSSPTYITLTSLALSDTCLILFLPFHIYVLYAGLVGDSGCRLFLLVIFTAQGSSIYHLVGFSILRYVILVKPLVALKYLTVKLTTVLCVVIWILALSGSALTLGITGQIVFNSSLTNASVPLCAIKYSSSPMLMSFFLYMGVLPLLLLFFFHTIKACSIRQNKIESESPVKQKQVSTKVIVGILVSFLLSNIPSGVGWFLLLSIPEYQSLEAAIAVYLLTTLIFLNSSLDPFIYFIFTHNKKRLCSARQWDKVTTRSSGCMVNDAKR